MQESSDMSRKLYVGNLSYNTTEADLESLFAQSGTVESVRVMRDMATGRARGFGFVEMSTDEEAQAAISATNGQEFGGRQLTVNEARPQEARSGGFGGNRGGGGGFGNGGGRGGRRTEPRW
jgi:RNA recognition motif-containing protein